MANRAYLYSSDRPDAWERPEQDYYDSRHTIPLSWFFFFGPSDITMVETTFDGTISWQEVKFAADKRVACEQFVARRALLNSWNAGRIENHVIDEFFETVRRRSGRYLLMDPGQVVEHSDEIVASEFASFLEKIGSGDRDARAVLNQARNYFGDFSDHIGQCLVDVVGCTYRWDQ